MAYVLSFERNGRWLQCLVAALMICGTTACFSGGKQSCDKSQEYQSSGGIEPLRVPDGMDEPDRAGGLTIPDAGAQPKGREVGDPCLESPPDYFGR